MTDNANRYKIVKTRVEVLDACPFLDVVLGVLQVARGKEKFWLTLEEVDGEPAFYRTDKSIYRKLKKFANAEEPDEETQAWHDELFEHNSLNFKGYEGFFEAPEEELTPVLRYLIYLTRSDWEDTRAFAESTQGKFVDELEIPASDVEEDWKEAQAYKAEKADRQEAPEHKEEEN